MTALHRAATTLDLGGVLRRTPHQGWVVALSAGEAVLGRLVGQQVVDIVTVDGSHEVRCRTADDLTDANVYELRAFTRDVEVTWRAGRAAWVSESLDALPLPDKAESVEIAARCDRRVLRPGQCVDRVPPANAPGEWSAWSNGEIGTRWYPVLPQKGIDRAGAVAVLEVVEYAYEVDSGPAEGNVAPLCDRWTGLSVVAPGDITCTPARQ